MTRTMVDVILKRFEAPDETRVLVKGRFAIVKLGGVTIGRATYEPGWKWSVHVGPQVGATRCELMHVGLVLLLKRMQAAEPHPEGLLFPDTYLFAKGSSDLAVLRRAYRAMQRHLKEEWEGRDTAVPYRSPYDALIMASIIEKETGAAGERDMIGGVLVNRLRIGMRLQVDPTVIYGLGATFDGNLKRSHLLEDGPYNTYTRAGLPPTPIAMPGLASLRSAMRPGKTDAMYYVSRNDGTSQFSRTLEEHNRAVARYQLRGGR